MLDPNTPPSENTLEIVAKLVQAGFTKICEITRGEQHQWAIYELPYHCVRQDLVFTAVVPGTFHQGTSKEEKRNIWQFKIPAVPMRACLDRKKGRFGSWITCPRFVNMDQFPRYMFAQMAGPRWAGHLDYIERTMDDGKLEPTSPGMDQFRQQGYKVTNMLSFGGTNIRYALTLVQRGNHSQTLQSPDAPTFVKYDADYRVYRGEEKEALFKLHFEFTADLHQKHNPYKPQPRTPPPHIKVES